MHILKIMRTFKRIKIKELIEIALGSLLVAIGFYFFLSPAKLVTGGVMGVIILIEDFLPSWLTANILLYILNIVFLLISLVFLGKKVFYKTIFATLLVPSFTLILSWLFNENVLFNKLKESPLLIVAVLSGVLIGIGLGMVIKNNASTGGMDVLQQILHKYLKIPFSFAMYVSDGVIIILGFLSFGFESGVYAIVSMAISAVLIDKMMLIGKSGYTVFIVTNQYEKLKEAIFERLDRGITKVHVVGGYTEDDKDMIICTVGRYELYELKSIITTLDPKAFTFITKTKESMGQGFSA